MTCTTLLGLNICKTGCKARKKYIACMHVDAGEAKEKLGIGVISVYSLREYLIGCKKTLWGDTSQDESCLQRVEWTFS